MGRVSGKVALVTGAASGIGRATAELLVEEGARVMLTDIDEEELRAVTTALGADAACRPLDVAVEAQWETAIGDTIDTFGRLDILVNNAGIPYVGLLEETPLEDWRHVMAINLDGTFLGTKYAIGAMKQDGGSIINVSSAGGLIGSPKMAAYNSSKGGVRLLTKCAAIECAQLGYNIRVNSVHPGAIDTPPLTGIMQRAAGVDEATAREMTASMQPLGRLGQAREIAFGILYLSSDESAFMTGSEFVIDGGITAQ